MVGQYHLLILHLVGTILKLIFVGNQAKMQTSFKAAMHKLALLGQDESQLIDCSEVIPVPPPLAGKPHLPAGLNQNDIEQAVSNVQSAVTCHWR
jgi:hypothetical protein